MWRVSGVRPTDLLNLFNKKQIRHTISEIEGTGFIVALFLAYAITTHQELAALATIILCLAITTIIVTVMCIALGVTLAISNSANKAVFTAACFVVTIAIIEVTLCVIAGRITLSISCTFPWTIWGTEITSHFKPVVVAFWITLVVNSSCISADGPSIVCHIIGLVVTVTVVPATCSIVASFLA